MKHFRLAKLFRLDDHEKAQKIRRLKRCSPCVSCAFSWLLLAVALPNIGFSTTNHFAHASTTETNVFLGQVFSVDVIVKAPEKPDAPNLSGINNFNATLLYAGKPTSGTNTWLYRFAFRAKHEGDLMIPALRFGEVYSKPVAIKANKPESTDRMMLNQQLSAQSVFVGEPVILTTTWDSTYQLGAIKAVDFHFPILNDKRFQTLELYDPNKETKASTTGLPVHGTRVLATRKNYTVENTQHQSLSFSKILIPKKSGKIRVPSATLLCATDKEKDTKSTQGRQSAFQYPAYFNNTFFDQNVTGSSWQHIYTESLPLELEVKPLPTEGRPALFNGMVGEYSIQVDAEPT
ncbi:MAG: BatD family protein, partial [Kiritimatiellaceae bacterium]|nr:BatD family protein [Kiritimatiellaceae bacterium]